MSIHRRRPALLVMLAALVMAPFLTLLPSIDAIAAPASGSAVEYSVTREVPPPPQPGFSGSTGGDGYGLAFHGDNVYTVFHHTTPFVVVCRNVYTGNDCDGYPKTVVDPGSGNANIWAYDYPLLHVDESTATLYSFGGDFGTNGMGVLAIDLNSADANPFAGFTPLGEMNFYGIHPTNPVLVGTRWYAFNFRDGSMDGTGNTMLCYDFATRAACPGQPFPMTFASTPTSAFGLPPESSRLGSKILMPIGSGGPGSYTGTIHCFDTAIDADCTGGSWPVALPGDPQITYAPAAVPVISAGGETVGACFASFDSSGANASPAPLYCLDPDGGVMASESSAVSAVINGNGFSPHNGAPWVIGRRVYVPQGNQWNGGPASSPSASQVQCFDWATGAECPGFPHVFDPSSLTSLYTIRADDSMPTCIWVIGDSGTDQIQNFDAFDGNACGEGGVRVGLRTFVAPEPECRPTGYRTLTVVSPTPGAYSGGTVVLEDEFGAPVAGVPTVPIVGGVADLSSVTLPGGAAIGMVQIDLPGVTGVPIEVSLLWMGEYHDVCVADGQTATAIVVPIDPVVPRFTG